MSVSDASAVRATPVQRWLRAVRSHIIVAGLAPVLLVSCSASSDKPVPSPSFPGIVVSAATLQTAEGGASVPFTVRLGTEPATDRVVVVVRSHDTSEGTLTTSSSATSGSSSVTLVFTTTDWSMPQPIWVLPFNDTVADGEITYTIEASVDPSTTDPTYLEVPNVTVTVTNADNDIPGFTVSKTSASTAESGGAAGSDSFTVVLNTTPTSTVTIPVQSLSVAEGKVVAGTWASCGSAQASVSLTFSTSNWSTPQTVTVCGQQDAVDDGNVTYPVRVGPPSGAVEYATLLAKTVSVTNSDDDTAGLTVAAGATPLVTTENGATATFSVKLNTMPLLDVHVPVTSGNVAEGLLSSGAENLRETVNLTFTSASWSTPQTVTVTGQDEVSTQVLGDNVTYDVTVGPPTGDPVYASSVARQTVHVTNVDNDAPAFVLSPPAGSNLTVYETGANTATFSVRINKQPTADVVIPVSASDATEALVQGGSSPSTPQQAIDLTFTQADWQTSQTVTVVGQTDGIVDGNQVSILTIGKPTSADAGFDALLATSLTVTTMDSVTTTWTSSDVPKAIPDLSTITSNLPVSGGPTSITKVTVKLSLTHTCDSDLGIYLIAPDATLITLSTANGGGGDNYTNTIFDDAAATSITSGSAPFTGTYRPEGLLSALNGKSANGTWQLRVIDSVGIDSGSLSSWSITVQ